MERVIVSVMRAGDRVSVDLELPAEIPASTLMPLVADALGWSMRDESMPADFIIEVESSGRVLEASETLAHVDAWDGAHLIFHPRPPSLDDEQRDPKTGDPARLDWPVQGWQPLRPGAGSR